MVVLIVSLSLLIHLPIKPSFASAFYFVVSTVSLINIGFARSTKNKLLLHLLRPPNIKIYFTVLYY